jgi:murein DD-endopeptidase MepM/ murein hydrolase activator NlpD
MNTPVMAVTDGTVVAQWNPSHGNIVEVTAPDGTQTWYTHLARARIRSGFVKAGTVIAYADSTGNSSGPHLHLEVHPGGGDAIDPLPWLRGHGHGLDPT